MILRHKHLSRIFKLVSKIVSNDGLNIKTTITNKEIKSIMENNRNVQTRCCSLGGIQNKDNGFQFDLSILIEKKPFSNEVELTIICPHCDEVLHVKEGTQLNFLGGI